MFLRGPNGVWTLEEKGLKPEINISFDEAVPTITHMAIVKLVESGELYEYCSCIFIN
jgi:mono-ADP-ribosyltransferase sirtuin 6